MDEYFSLKVVALLHDPPDKSWEISGHEERAKNLLKMLTEGTALEGCDGLFNDERISWADRFVSTVDRWIVDMLVGGRKYLRGAFREEPGILKNIFYPWINLRIIKPYNVEPFVKELKNILNIASRDERLFWHLLYAFYEGIWYKYNPKSVSVADTRVPTHTIFDHVYATSAAINWGLHEKKPSGFYVIVDVPGVQAFIKNSRKLRDLWFSSYYVSAATWYSIKIFVEKLGPDVLLIPSARNNPFYYHWLASEMYSRVKLSNEMIELIEVLSGYNPRKGFPRHAVIPATITLILPPIEYLNKYVDPDISNKEDIAKLISDRFIEAWKIVWEEVIKYLEREAESKDIGKEIFEGLLNALREFEDEFKGKPPLGLRIVIQDVSEVLDLNIEDYEIFDKISEKAFKKLRKLRYVRYNPASRYNLYKVTSKVWAGKKLGFPKKSRRGFDYCTLCGELPAIVILPREEEYEKIMGDKGFEILLPPGERLCPVCFVKRVATFELPLISILEKLLGKSYGSFEISFPTLGDIASLDFKESIIRALGSGKDHEKLLKVIEEIVESLSTTAPSTITIKAGWGWHRKISRDVTRLDIEGKDKVLLFVFGDAEREYLKYDARMKYYVRLKDAIKSLDKILASTPLNRYYAVIRADVDNMGKLLQGNVAEGYALEKADVVEFMKNYLVNALSGKLAGLVKLILDSENPENDKKVKERFIRLAGISEEEARERIRRFMKIYNKIKKGKLPATFTYQVSLSRVLMMFAVRESEIVEENDGFVVYSGGDDLLALAPSSRALEIALKTRRLWTYGDTDLNIHGFMVRLSKKEKGKVIVPTVYPSGRSYSVTFSHYMYPLRFVLPYSHEMLEISKSTVLTDKDNMCKILLSSIELNSWSSEIKDFCKDIKEKTEAIETKDALTISYVVRGCKRINAVIPWRNYPHFKLGKPLKIGEIIEKLYDIYKLIDPMTWRFINKSNPKLLSMSLIYDLLENEGLLGVSLLKNKELSHKILERIFYRNTINKNMFEYYVKPIIEELKAYLNNMILLKKYNEVRIFVSQIPLFLKIYRGGVRG